MYKTNTHNMVDVGKLGRRLANFENSINIKRFNIRRKCPTDEEKCQHHQMEIWILDKFCYKNLL